MAEPYRIIKSELQLPHKRVGHVAVTWKNAILIWGGQTVPYSQLDSHVYMYLSGKWTKKETTGHVPKICDGMAHVVNDKMFVLGSEILILNNSDNLQWVYSLDLNTWVWTKLAPRGTPLKGRTMGPTSWVHKERIFILGGYEIKKYHNAISYVWPKSKRLPCYNIASNSWEWMKQDGDIPSKRFQHSTVISGDTLYLFGGFSNRDGYVNDLHVLDMVSMRWAKVHGNILDNNVPCNESNGKFTLVSQSMAMLYLSPSEDGVDSRSFESCWLLNLEKAKQLMDPSSIWTKIPPHFSRPAIATTVFEPVSRSLWITGGYIQNPDGPTVMTSQVLIMPLNPSLKDLAVATVARNHCPQDPRLAPDNLASHLRDEVAAYRVDILGETVCSREKRC